MIGKQINFYLMEDDLKEVDVYIKKSGLYIFPNFTKDSSLNPLSSLLDNHSYLIKYLAVPSAIKEIVKRYVDTQDYYTIDVLESPVIELNPGYIDKNLKRRGRIYYTKNSIGSNGFEKNKSFLEMSNEFFKWFRKNFKNVKLKGLENILVSERTLQWLEASKDNTLSDLLESKQKQLVA